MSEHNRKTGTGSGVAAERFRNPYNFIPLGDVSNIGTLSRENPLGQGKPKGHHRYHGDHWSGRIGIRIEVVTPLLIPDAAKEQRDERKDGHATQALLTYSHARDDGSIEERPLLSVTSLKGPLRSAYEAVTNSRMGVFQGHGAPLARRMTTDDARGVIPARVDGTGSRFEILTGHPARLFVTVNGERRPRPAMAGAWLNSYFWNGTNSVLSSTGPSYPSGQRPQHGDEVICEIKLRLRGGRFAYWQVVGIQPRATATLTPTTGAALRLPNDPSWTVGDQIVVSGHVFISHHNVGNKHDERVFFSTTSPPGTVSMAPDVPDRWRDLVLDYKNRHRDAVRARENSKRRPDWSYGRNIGETAFSRHVLEYGYEELAANRLCYLRLDAARTQAIAAYPVIIGRELGHVSPERMLPKELKPGDDLNKLSPADRAFGWVRQGRWKGKGKDAGGGWRGQLRIHPIQWEGLAYKEGAIDPAGQAIERFAPPLPLAILSTPKVAQARFYVGTKNGQPLGTLGGCPPAFKNAETRDKGYFEKHARGASPSSALRGRKVYPHQRQISPLEYKRADGTQDSQNRSIAAWVAPGTVFTTDIDVINLNDAELGALLWLLDLPHCCAPKDGNGNPLKDAEGKEVEGQFFHRIGGGKPLGFGSVRITLASLDLKNGQAKANEFKSLFTQDEKRLQDDGGETAISAGADGSARQESARKVAAQFVAAYTWATGKAYLGNEAKFDEVPFITAFLQAAAGYDDNLPTHYPRNTATPDPAGKNYAWFVANERQNGKKYALGPLEGDPGLPYDPTKSAANAAPPGAVPHTHPK